MNRGVTENETMNKREHGVAHLWKLLGCVGIVALNVFTLTPAFSANQDDEIAELKATIEALQRRV